MNNVLDILEERGLLDDLTSPDLKKILESPITLYAGFDPTQESLQLGNFVTIMVMAHFQRCGHKVIAVVGGATGMIGDPSGKTQERSLLSSEDIERNQAGIHENLSRFLDFDHPTAPAVILNNNDWLKEFSFVDFLRDVGKHFRMGSMLGKESVRARLNSDAGMSFTEFSYQMLQAYDFLKLYDSHDCVLQIGGSDQWGNITAGVDLLRKLRSVEGFGMTFPLLCDSNGQKFGKSEGNALFLSSAKTSYYDFYQFFVRTADADVIPFLKVLTFLSMEEILEFEKQVEESPERRSAQKRLAEEVTRMVHGEDGLQTAMRASGVLFGESMEGLNAEELQSIFADVPSTELSRSDIEGVEAFEIAVSSGMCSSKGEARRLVKNGGLYLNNRRVEGLDAKVLASDIIDGELVVLRSGKKRFHLIRIS
jgi:tyrosyl-tRNA synthetase